MNARIHLGARRKIRRLVAGWVREYPTPEIPDDALSQNATRWARTVLDEVFDVAVERPLAVPIWVASFASSVSMLTVSIVKHQASSFAADLVTGLLWAVTIVAMIGVSMATSPRSSADLRAAIAQRIIESAVRGVQRRRAFVARAPEATTKSDWQTFERIAIRWMHHLGDVGMQETRKGADGGIDGLSDRFVMQAKCWKRDDVGVELVRALHGVATEQQRGGVFFTTRGYTKAALDFARRTGMPLFILDLGRGRLTAANPAALRLRTHGVHVFLNAASRELRPLNA